ncbi:hypothetical protein Tco_0915302 [Tanacetum coccineum]
MLLNAVRGVKGFEALMTVNKRLCATFKETCFACDLLNEDKEWSHTIAEASLWALGPQLRDIFVTMLMFCDVIRPLKLWEETWETLSEDILEKNVSSLNTTLRDILGFKDPNKASNLWGHNSVAGRSELWRYCKVFTLTRSIRVNECSANRGIAITKQEFSQWVLAAGDALYRQR